MPKKCSECGKINDDLVSFCVNCKSTKFENKNVTSFIEKAEQGNVKSQFNLGKAYLFGLYGIEKDIVKAKNFLILADKGGHPESEQFLQICEATIQNNSYDMTKLLLKNNKTDFPAVICKDCESIIPISKLSHNYHRTVQVYGTNFFSTLTEQAFYDALLSRKEYSCPICSSENLIMLGTPLSESMIKKHSDNEQYIKVLLSDIECITPNFKNPKKKEGCYIATCIYGSYNCQQVFILRRYRDNNLQKIWYGRVFIYIYYAISPYLVKVFGKTKWFKNMLKPILDKIVKILQNKNFSFVL